MIRELPGYARPVREVDRPDVDYLQRQARLHVEQDLVVRSVQGRQRQYRAVVVRRSIDRFVRIGFGIEQALHVTIALALAMSRQRHRLHQRVGRGIRPGRTSPAKADVGVHPRLVVMDRFGDRDDERGVSTVHRLVRVRGPE